LPFRDFGCGKAISFDDLFEEIGLTRGKKWRHKDPMNPSERIDELIPKVVEA